MKSVVIYDSVYGNTERIAQAVAGALGPARDVTLLRAAEAKPEQLKGATCVIVGAPTQGFRPTLPVKTFLDAIPAGMLKGVKVAAFDTRMAGKEVGPGIRLLTKVGGFAAKHIAEGLKKAGGELAAPPEGFNVKGKEGPLATGELERAASWGKGLAAAPKG